MEFWILFAIGIPVFIILAIFGALAAKKRREELSMLAGSLGLSYSSGNDYEIARRFRFLEDLSRGKDRYAYNVIKGDYQGYQVMAFDFHYETEDGDGDEHDHTFSFFTLLLKRNFSELTLSKEGIFSKIGQALGFNDIDFESVEFSDRYKVKARDKKFAYDFCNSRMISYLLDQEVMHIEVERNVLSLGANTCLSAARFKEYLDRLVEIRKLMPDYLFEDI